MTDLVSCLGKEIERLEEMEDLKNFLKKFQELLMCPVKVYD